MNGRIMMICVALLTISIAIPTSATANYHNQNIKQETLNIVGPRSEEITINKGLVHNSQKE